MLSNIPKLSFDGFSSSVGELKEDHYNSYNDNSEDWHIPIDLWGRGEWLIRRTIYRIKGFYCIQGCPYFRVLE